MGSSRQGRSKHWPAGATALGLVGVSMLALVAAAPPAAAETLRQALAAAYQSNPKLDAERARLRATDEEVPRAEAGFRPLVTGEADAGKTSVTTKPLSSTQGTTAPYGYQVTLKQPVFNGFRTTNSVAEAEAGVRAGREQLRQVEITTLLDATSAYMALVRDQAIVELRDRMVAVLTKDVEAAETRRQVREVTRTDVAQARARRAKAVSAADLAKANLKIARATFTRVVGHAPGTVASPSLKIKQLPHSLEEALSIAEQDSPNLAGALYREEAARHAVDVVRGELLPEVHIEASYGRQYEGVAYLAEQDTASVTGRITVPFYEGGEVQARVRQAKHTHVSRLQEIEQYRTEVREAVTAAWSKMMAARAQLKSDEVQVDASRTALEGVREEEKVGQRTLLDVLNAEQEYLDAQVALVSTRYDLVVASYSLLGSIGRLTAASLSLGSAVYDPEAHYEEVRGRWFGLSIEHGDGRREVVQATDEANEPDPVNE